eukprot:COSAG02_NODE_174_length_31243_cov_76.084543_22_plen_51_part_00
MQPHANALLFCCSKQKLNTIQIRPNYVVLPGECPDLCALVAIGANERAEG